LKNATLSYVDHNIDTDFDRAVINEAFGKIRKNLCLSIEGKVRTIIALETLPSLIVVLLIYELDKQSERLLELGIDYPQCISKLTLTRGFEWESVLNIVNDS